MVLMDQSSLFIDSSSYVSSKNPETTGQMIKNIANIAIPVIVG